jgi:hypothetical protein
MKVETTEAVASGDSTKQSKDRPASLFMCAAFHAFEHDVVLDVSINLPVYTAEMAFGADKQSRSPR